MFIPSFTTTDDEQLRWLVSAGNDCAVVFHRYNERTKQFFDPPTKFNERASGGARIISASHSPGGSFVIMGDTHKAIIMYRLSAIGVERLYELCAHSDRIDSLVWAHRSLRFASGSKDGTAKAWSFKRGKWRSVELTLPSENTAGHGERTSQIVSQSKKNSANAYKVTMLAWSLDDDLIVSIGSDYLLRTWNWRDGKMLGKFAGHQNDAFTLFAHPIHRELMLSAGHDGFFFIWDIYSGRPLCRHRNENTNHETVAIFDMAIASDGTTVGCVDSMGHLSIYSVANSQQAMTRPHEQFFSTDYRLIQVDPEGRVTDDDTGLPPEALSPPLLVTSDGNLHPDAVQKLVPGNDINSDDVIKPCAWIKRDIIPPMRHSELNKYRQDQIEYNRLEMQEYERRAIIPLDLVDLEDDEKPINIGQRDVKCRRTRRFQTAESSAAANRRADIRYLAEYLLQNRPRYVLDDQYTDDENDLSFSLGSAEEDEEGNERANAISRSRSTSDDGETDDSSEDGDEGTGDEDDENDSDYQVGRTGQDTVFRARSTWTVTGKRKRRTAPITPELEQNEGNSSQTEEHFHSERLRARAAAAALRSAALDQQPTSTSRLAAQQPCRTIRTRRSAFIASSEDDDKDSRERDVKIESEVKHVEKVTSSKRGRKKVIEIELDDDEEEEADKIEIQTKEKRTMKKRIGRGRKKLVPVHRSIKSTRNLRRSSRRASVTPAASRERGQTAFTVQVEFPTWMRTTDRRRFPFIPQIGDLVVYFLQGYRTYIEEMQKAGFRIPSKLKIETFLDAQEVCYIDEITYINISGKSRAGGVIQVAQLRLARTKNGKRNGTAFYICYHDMKHVIDYLVLKQHFDSSMEMHLTQGDRVESIIDDKYYTGIVIKKDPYEADYPNSEWSTISIRWDNGDELDRLNPWDLQKLTPGRKSEKQATPQDLFKLSEYRPAPGEWATPAQTLGERLESVAEDLYLDRVSDAINKICQLRSVLPFCEPVDLQRYTNYIGAVNYPIDLRTIQERIHNRFYRRSLSLLHDVQHIAKNAIAFNNSESPIVLTACALVETIFTFMQDWNETDPVEMFHRFEHTDKFHCYQQKLRPAESISTRPQAILGRTRNSGAVVEGNASGSSEQQQCCSSSSLSIGATKQQAVTTTKEQKVPLWAEECREMVQTMTDVFWNRANNRDVNEFAFSFLNKLRTIVEPISQYKEPDQFFERLRKFLSEQKNRVMEQESKRSKTFLGILQMESLLESKRPPIEAKFRRMVAAETPAAALSISSYSSYTAGGRQQRQAALSAREYWRNIDDDDDDDDEDEELERRKGKTAAISSRKRTAAVAGSGHGMVLRQRTGMRMEGIEPEFDEDDDDEDFNYQRTKRFRVT